MYIFIAVVILAEDDSIQAKLADHDIFVQTVPEASPIQVYPARVLTQLYSLLGRFTYNTTSPLANVLILSLS